MTSRRARVVVATLVALLLLSAVSQAQDVTPRGIAPPRRNTPEFPERDLERARGRREPRGDNAAVYRRLILEQIQKDFEKLQALKEDLSLQLAANSLDYKHIADAAAKIRTLARRLDSNLVLGKVESPIAGRAEPGMGDLALRSLLLTLRNLVGSFVDNPIFRERIVYDVEETRKAKSDVVEIVLVSDEVKRLAKQLRRNTAK